MLRISIKIFPPCQPHSNLFPSVLQVIHAKHIVTTYDKAKNLINLSTFLTPQIKSSFVFQTIWYLAREIVVVQVSAIFEKMHQAKNVRRYYENELSSTNSSLRLTSFSIDGLIVPLK